MDIGAGRLRRAGRALLLALLAGQALVDLAGGQCTLGLDIDQPKSPLTAGGQLLQPLQEGIIVNSSQQLSLSGKLYLSFPGGACPGTPQTFANALPGAAFVTPEDAEPVQLQPPTFSAQVRLAGKEFVCTPTCTIHPCLDACVTSHWCECHGLPAQIGTAALATITFLGLEFNLSSQVLPPLPARPASGAYATSFNAQVVNGSSSVQTSLPIAGSGASGGDSTVQMSSLTTNSSVLISVYQNVRTTPNPWYLLTLQRQLLLHHALTHLLGAQLSCRRAGDMRLLVTSRFCCAGHVWSAGDPVQLQLHLHIQVHHAGHRGAGAVLLCGHGASCGELTT